MPGKRVLVSLSGQCPLICRSSITIKITITIKLKHHHAAKRPKRTTHRRRRQNNQQTYIRGGHFHIKSQILELLRQYEIVIDFQGCQKQKQTDGRIIIQTTVILVILVILQNERYTNIAFRSIRIQSNPSQSNPILSYGT